MGAALASEGLEECRPPLDGHRFTPTGRGALYPRTCADECVVDASGCCPSWLSTARAFPAAGAPRALFSCAG